MARAIPLSEGELPAKLEPALHVAYVSVTKTKNQNSNRRAATCLHYGTAASQALGTPTRKGRCKRIHVADVCRTAANLREIHLST